MIENKTGKYIIYAIGEIVLVMICILLALQVNNWNTQKNQNKTKAEILNSLINNLEEDKISLIKHANYDALRSITANLILDTLKGKPIEYSAKKLSKLDIHYNFRKNIGQVLEGEWSQDFFHILVNLLGNDLSFQSGDMTYNALIQGDNTTLNNDIRLDNSISEYYNSVYYLNRGENTMRDELSLEFKRQLMSDSRLTNDFEFFTEHSVKFENWIILMEKNATYQKYSYQQLLVLHKELQDKIRQVL